MSKGNIVGQYEMGWMILLVLPGVPWIGLLIGHIVELPKLFSYYERDQYLETLKEFIVYTFVLGVIAVILFFVFNYNLLKG